MGIDEKYEQYLNARSYFEGCLDTFREVCQEHGEDFRDEVCDLVYDVSEGEIDFSTGKAKE